MPPRRAPARQTRQAPAPEPPIEEKDTPLFAPGFDESDSEPDRPDSPTKTRRSAPPTETAPAEFRAPSAPAADSPKDSDDESEDDDDLDGYESEDDPIVREYDVYMTSELAQSLYLFQYPVRSGMKPYTKAQNSCPVDARLKPKSGLVEVDVPVNVAVNYDEEKGRVWGDVLRKAKQAQEGALTGKGAVGAKGAGTKKRRVKNESDDDEEEEQDVMLMEFNEAVKKGRVLNKQTLGSKMQPDETKYMVGVFKFNELHLTPIKSTVQLRPQFAHVDAQSAQERQASRAARDADQPEKPAEARAVHLTVKNPGDPTSQMSSTQAALRLAESESWTTLHWLDQDSDEAWDQYEMLCLKDPENAPKLRAATTKQDYMEWISGQKLAMTMQK